MDDQFHDKVRLEMEDAAMLYESLVEMRKTIRSEWKYIGDLIGRVLDYNADYTGKRMTNDVVTIRNNGVYKYNSGQRIPPLDIRESARTLFMGFDFDDDLIDEITSVFDGFPYQDFDHLRWRYDSQRYNRTFLLAGDNIHKHRPQTYFGVIQRRRSDGKEYKTIEQWVNHEIKTRYNTYPQRGNAASFLLVPKHLHHEKSIGDTPPVSFPIERTEMEGMLRTALLDTQEYHTGQEVIQERLHEKFPKQALVCGLDDT